MNKVSSLESMSAIHKKDLAVRESKKKKNAHSHERTIKKEGPFSATVEFEDVDHEEKNADKQFTKNPRAKYKQYQPDWYPWEMVEELFVKGAADKTGAIHYPTIGELADHFGISFTAIRDKMTQQDWYKRRVKYQAEKQRISQEKSIEDLYETALRFDAACIQAAEMAIQEIINYFVEAKVDQERVSKLDLDRMGRSAVNWQRVGRLALGLSTENSAAKLETTGTHTIQSIDLTHMTEEELALLEKLARASDLRTLPPQKTTIIEETSSS